MSTHTINASDLRIGDEILPGWRRFGGIVSTLEADAIEVNVFATVGGALRSFYCSEAVRVWRDSSDWVASTGRF